MADNLIPLQPRTQETSMDMNSMSGSHAPPLPARGYPAPKPQSGWSVDRPVHRVIRQWHANALSLLGAGLCIAAGVSLAVGAPVVLSAILFPLGGLCDLADGMVARAAADRPSSSNSAFLDSICDKIGEASLYAGVAFYAENETVTLAVLTAVLLGSLTSYTTSAACQHRLDISWPEARIFGRAGRVILLSGTLLALTLDGGSNTALVVGFVVLAAFNGASFIWRLGRIAWRLVPPMASR